MGIKCTTDINELFTQVAKIIDREVTLELQYLGEECNNKIRNRSSEDSWIDQTGNLRSSIGYSVLRQGEKKAQGGFTSILGAEIGGKLGRSYIKHIAELYADDYALIVVAGMDYAQYVEAMKNKDVLATTRMWAEAEIDERLWQAQKRIEKKVNKLLK